VRPLDGVGPGRSWRPAAACFVASLLGTIGFVVAYIEGGQTQLEGLFLAISLGGIGIGLILWAQRLMPVGHSVQSREKLPSPAAERERAERSFERGAEILSRRQALLRLLGAALAALGAAALFPIRSLGRAPGSALLHTEWKAGLRAVTVDGTLVTASQVPQGAIVTVFPEGFAGSADSQTVLIGLEPGAYHPLPGRADWAPNNIVAYSKVCTHAGCPVGLYQPSTHELFCPCHQSVFDVTDGAMPVGGPATRPLPQLPIEIDPQGAIVARSDFTEPIGPGFWSRPGG
jgi:ubiquinol-cytochrome c reductase iron-sulfur subunit